MEKYINYIKDNNLGSFYDDKTFKELSTIKIGGKIKLLYYPNTIENFIFFYKFYLIDKKYPLIILGNGSNILASSNDYIGIVVSFKKLLYKYSIINNKVFVTSGVMIMDLINYCKINNLGGLEKLSYIPATIGGMIKMNASAYKSNISDYLINVKCIDSRGKIKIYKKENIIFGYRNTSISKDDIILECTFDLIRKEEKDINKIITNIKNNRINKQPLNEYNAGSTFKNPIDISAWKLIEEVNMRGYRINDAMVSNKHCNFLINKKNSNSTDMISLINMIKNKVYEKYNYNLECEWILINF